MIVSDTAVRHRVSVIVLSLIIVIAGINSYISLPRESEPDINLPYVFVSTNYKGVSASDIETSITIPIEKKLKGLEGVKKMASSSSEGISSISIEFVTGTDIDDALQKVRNKVDEAKGELPGDLEDDPSVFEVNLSEMPIVTFSLSGTCGRPCLKNIADELQDEFEAIPGVLEAEVAGGLEREIRIEVRAERLAYYGIPITSLQGAVSGENQNTSGGAIRLGDGRYQLSVPGEFEDPQELYGVVVGVHEGQPVYLRDVATVVDGYKDETSRSRLDSLEAVSIAVKKRAGENVIAITDRIDDIIDRQELTWPSGTSITKTMDKAKEIRLMVADLENNILSGLILVLVVLFFALGFRNAFLVSLAIPFSMFISFAVLHVMGITLNNVVLFSLTLALGMLVDNAIVIVENIYRHTEQGVPRMEAAMGATSEVAYAVIGSTITTLVAFSPLLFWEGIMGEFMRYLPLTLIVTLSSSLFVAMVINPALASYFIKVKGGVRQHSTAHEVRRAGESPVAIEGRLLKLYEKTLHLALRNRVVVLVLAFLVLFILFFLWQFLVGIERPEELFPSIEPPAMYVNVDMPEGASLEYSDAILKKIEALIYGASKKDILEPEKPLDDIYYEAAEMKGHMTGRGFAFMGPSDFVNVEHVYARSVIGQEGGMSFEGRTPNHIGIQFLDFNDRIESSHDTVSRIRSMVRDVPGAEITVKSAEGGPPTGAPINIEISGDDYRMLGAMAGQIRGELERMPHMVDIADDYVAGSPSVRVRIDRQRAALFGLSTGNIGYALKAGYNGLQVSTFREGGDDYDITVQLDDPDRRVTDVLRELMLPTPSGRLVPLTSLASIEFSGNIGTINHIDSERVVTVKANVEDIPGPVAREAAEKELKKLALPPGYKVKFTGEFEFEKESKEFLSRAFMLALLFIFLVLVTQFNSVPQPFIIMTAVLLSLGGAFLGLTVIDSPFGIIMTGVGVISLAGVVVNNGIVLIDYINKLRERGMDVAEAVVAGGATRLRPVLLTAITTILGLLPMVTGVSYDFHEMAFSWSSEASQWWRTMAIVVIFGLMVATFLTLVVVPTFYSLLYSMGRGMDGLVERVRELFWRPYEIITGQTAASRASRDDSARN